MKTLWMIVAGACIAVAAVLILRGNIDAAFVVAVIGLVAWFINYRLQVKATLVAEDAQQDESIGDKDSDEDQQR